MTKAKLELYKEVEKEYKRYLKKDEFRLLRKLNKEGFKVIKVENEEYVYWRSWFFTIQTSNNKIAKISASTSDYQQNSLIIRVKKFEEARQDIYEELCK